MPNRHCAIIDASMVALVVLLAVVPSSGRVLRVGASSPAEYATIPDAVASAAEGDTVLVYPGVYRVSAASSPEGNRWPIALREHGPVIIAGGGHGSVVIEGYDWKSAFFVDAESGDPIHLSDFAYRHVWSQRDMTRRIEVGVCRVNSDLADAPGSWEDAIGVSLALVGQPHARVQMLFGVEYARSAFSQYRPERSLSRSLITDGDSTTRLGLSGAVRVFLKPRSGEFVDGSLYAAGRLGIHRLSIGEVREAGETEAARDSATAVAIEGTGISSWDPFIYLGAGGGVYIGPLGLMFEAGLTTTFESDGAQPTFTMSVQMPLYQRS